MIELVSPLPLPGDAVSRRIGRRLGGPFNADPQRGVPRGFGNVAYGHGRVGVRFSPSDFGLKKWPDLEGIASRLKAEHGATLSVSAESKILIIARGGFRVEPEHTLTLEREEETWEDPIDPGTGIIFYRKTVTELKGLSPGHPEVEVITNAAKMFIEHMQARPK